MFTLPVWDILTSYTWDSKQFVFSGPVPDGYLDDLSFLSDLSFEIEIYSLDDGVRVVFRDLSCTVKYEGVKHIVKIGDFDRDFTMKHDPLEVMAGTYPIRNHSIDLAPVLREEIIMACHEL